MESTVSTTLSHCVIIPTYNNIKTLKRVIDGVLTQVDEKDIIIVNDGSTDGTSKVLKAFEGINLIEFPKNIGKGYALRQGFKKAIALGYTHAITIDSDGQHFPEDIPILLSASKKEPTALFIGSRNMKQEGVPAKSSFGNKFSNFWFWFETGKKLEDTQSGFRLYPIHIMPKRWFTKKFEFEIECIVRSAWKGIEVKNIPVQIKYDENERVSHFRPFKDFTRISILNTVLVIFTLLYYLPKSFFNSFKKKSLRNFIKEDILGSGDSPKVKSLSLALGVFIGIIPIWGFQTVAVLFLAVSFKLNKLLAFAASNVSIPPMIPIIVISSLYLGGLFTNHNIDQEEYSNVVDFKNHLIEYLLGSFVLATTAAILVGTISYFILISIQRKRGNK